MTDERAISYSQNYRQNLRTDIGTGRPDIPMASGILPVPNAEYRTRETPELRLELLDSLEKGRAIWRSFERRASPSPFQTYSWINNWFQHVGARSNVKPVIVFGYDEDDKLRLVMPLGVRHSTAGKRLIWLGDEFSGYNCPLIDPVLLRMLDNKDVSKIWQNVINAIDDLDLVHLIRQPKRCGTHNNPFLLNASVSKKTNDRTISLTDSWDEFVETHNPEKMAHRNLEATRLLKNRGSLNVSLNVAPQDRSEVIDHIFGMSPVDSKKGLLSSSDAKQELRSFYESLADMETGSPLNVTSIDVDGSLVAGAIGYLHGDQYFVAMTAVENSTEGRAAEYVLGVELIRSCIVKGLKRIEFLGDTVLVPEWSSSSNQLFDTMIGLSARGVAASAIIRTSSEIFRPFGRSRIMAGGTRKIFDRHEELRQ